VNLGDEDVKRRKDEKFGVVGVIFWGRIPGMELEGGERCWKNIFGEREDFY
jgi:hypothetical protein